MPNDISTLLAFRIVTRTVRNIILRRPICIALEVTHNCTANCRAGRRFLVVNPDGTLTPCAMFIEEQYDSRRELIDKFANKNECGCCYISIRANTEKSPWELLTDSLRFVKLS